MEYVTFSNDAVRRVSREDLDPFMRVPGQFWSARVSTGLFGLYNCKPGNYGPKNTAEVLVAIGDEGLRRFVELGFITCPSCKPEQVPGFWNIVEDTVEDIYGFKTLEEFKDKDILGYDARRINWENILSLTGEVPNRIYLPEGLSEVELLEFQERFSDVELPPRGWYDVDAPGRFSEY